MIFMKRFSRSSLATGPKIRVPRGFLASGVSKTTALSSNLMYEPSERLRSLAVRTTTAFTTSPFFTAPPGSASFTEPTITSPTPEEMTMAEPNEPPAPSPTTASAPAAGESRSRRKVRVGVVVSDKMDKTVLVRIDRRVRHPLYKKTVARTNKLAAHDETNDAHVGDTVRIMETRRLSKSKRWRVVEIVERAK